jgi:hypothetical protein
LQGESKARDKMIEMTAAFFIILIALWIFYAGWRFYKNVNWNEPPGETPDFAQLRKREAEILHIQGFLEEAHGQGKLSDSAMKECQALFDQELIQIRKVVQ